MTLNKILCFCAMTVKTFKQKTGLILTYDQKDEKIADGSKIVIKPVWKWLLDSTADDN